MFRPQLSVISFSFDGPLQRNAKISEVQMKYYRLVEKLCNFYLECITWRFFAPERGDEIIIPRALQNAFRYNYKPLKAHIAVFQREKKTLDSKREACNAKVSHLQVLRRYRNVCKHVARPLRHEEVWLEAARTAATSEAEDEASRFLRGLRERSPTGVKVPRGVENRYHNIVSGQPVLGDALLDVGFFTTFREVLLLPFIDALDSNSFTLPASNIIQTLSSLCSNKCSKAPPKKFPKRRNTLTIQTRSDASKLSSDDVPVIDYDPLMSFNFSLHLKPCSHSPLRFPALALQIRAS